MPPHFDIGREPCIPVRTGRRHDTVGLRELFLRAHQIEDLALPIPPAASALLRILTAITARLTDLDDPEMSAEEWTARRYTSLKGPGFEPNRVHAYFDTYIWDLFHPTRPFMQDRSLTEQCKPSGVNSLVFGRPAGNNLAWLSPHHDIQPVPVPCDEALWHLLIHHYYGAAGRCTARTVDGRSTTKGTAGPLRSTISFHPLGRTLYETLLLGLPKPTGDWPGIKDTCPWEEPGPQDPQQPIPPVTWPGRLLTGRSRHAALLVPSADGRAVTDAYLTWSTQHPKQEAIDPYLSYHVKLKTAATRHRTPRRADNAPHHTPRRADADRAWWRDLDALLLAGDETSTTRRPRAFDTLNDLPPDIRAAVRVRAHGFDQEGKTNNRIWYTALTPPIWTWAQEHDPAQASRIEECRAAAEKVGDLLQKAAARAWHEATKRPRDDTPAGVRAHKAPKRVSSWATRAAAEYWPQAETTFWRLINEDPAAPARPAFARCAVAALRTVTRPALVQFRHAGPAVARAVAALRTDPALRYRQKKAAS